MKRFLFCFLLSAFCIPAFAFQGQQPIAANYDDSRTFIAADDTITGSNLRVKITVVSGNAQVTLANSGDQAIGTSVGSGSSNVPMLVKLIKVGTIRVFAAAGTISPGNAVYGAANGLVSTTQAGNRIGIALQSAVNSGDLIEVMVLDASTTGAVGPTGPTGATGPTGS
jgi:hypothetical protein